MSRLPPFLQVILAGILASLLTSLIFLGFDLGGVFHGLGIPIRAEDDLIRWFGVRLIFPGFLALLLLLPVLTDWRLWQRGLLIGLIPAAELFLYRYPFDKKIGFFGLDLGLSVTLSALFFSLLWGAMTGWLLHKLGFPDLSMEDEPEI